MSTYAFRLRFTVSHAPAFLHDGGALDLELPGHSQPCSLRPLDADRIRDAKDLTLNSAGFPSEDAAREAGERARRALRLVLVDLRKGFDVGDRPSTLSFGKVVLDQAREMGFELRGDAHGLTVYPDDIDVRFASMKAEAVVSSPLEKFVDGFTEDYERGFATADRASLGLELYGLSYFESSARARFITLITAIESSVKPTRRSAEAQRHVEALIKATQASELLKDDSRMLVAALGNLKNESIAAACRRFVSENGGPGDVEIWERCHKTRHAMLHAGGTPSDLRGLLPKLDEVVRRSLLNLARGGSDDVA